MEISREHQTGYGLIELRVILQRAIEIMDDLDIVKYPLRNKALQSQLKAIYPALDKETKKYNAMFEVSPDGALNFYNIVHENARFVMQNHLIDKGLIAQFLTAHDKNPRAIEGIIDKILKQK